MKRATVFYHLKPFQEITGHPTATAGHAGVGESPSVVVVGVAVGTLQTSQTRSTGEVAPMTGQDDSDHDSYSPSTDAALDTVEHPADATDSDSDGDPDGHFGFDLDRRSFLGGMAAAGGLAAFGRPALADRESGGDHSAVMDLVPTDEVTHTATSSGAWSTAGTWDNGLPGDGAKVHVPEGTTVTVDGEFDARIHWIRVDGTLRFATSTDTHLRVETIVTTEGSRFEIGTESNPVESDVTAQITFIDRGPIDESWDPKRKSRGLLTMGAVRTKGQTTSPFHELASDPKTGDDTLELTEAPTGWEQGDTVVVPSCSQEEVHRLMDFDHPGGKYPGGSWSPFPTQDEERTITGVSGTTISLDSALEHDHAPPKDDLPIHAANLDRNIRLESENDGNIGLGPNSDPDDDNVGISVGSGDEHNRRAHVMFMNQDVKFRDVALYDLGRTNKWEPFSNPTFGDHSGSDVNQFEAPGYWESDGKNPKARYSCHFHKTGLREDGWGVDTSVDPGVVEGCAVWGNPGWGIVNHDSYVDVSDCVTYEVMGAHYVTEAGWEEGSFTNCIAIRAHGSGFGLGARGNQNGRGIGDFGIAGSGFWLQGLGVLLEDCVAAGCYASGFDWRMTHVTQKRHADLDWGDTLNSGTVPTAEGNAANSVLKIEDPKSETTRLNRGNVTYFQQQKLPKATGCVTYESQLVGTVNHYNYRAKDQRPLAEITKLEMIGYNIHRGPIQDYRELYNIFPMDQSKQLGFERLYIVPNNDQVDQTYYIRPTPDAHSVLRNIRFEGDIKLQINTQHPSDSLGTYWGLNIDVPTLKNDQYCRMDNVDADTVTNPEKLVSFEGRSVARAEAHEAALTGKDSFSVVDDDAASEGKLLTLETTRKHRDVGNTVGDDRITVSFEDVPEGEYRVYVRYKGQDFSEGGDPRMAYKLDPEVPAEDLPTDSSKWSTLSRPTKAGAGMSGTHNVGNVANPAWGGDKDPVSLGGDHELVLAEKHGVEAVDSVLLVEHRESDPDWKKFPGPKWPAEVEERIADAGEQVTPSVSMSNQTSDGESVTVDSAANPEEFAIVVHQGGAGGPMIGSTTVHAGDNADVQVDLEESLSTGEHTLVPMLHQTASSGHGPPITVDGEMVTDTATVTVERDQDCQSVRAAIAGEDDTVDDAEMLEAIQHWQTESEVPGTCGETVSDTDLLDLINAWQSGDSI